MLESGLTLSQFNIVAMDADEKSGNRYIDEGVSKAIDLIQQHEWLRSSYECRSFKIKNALLPSKQ
jgi:hypothetical protein